MRKFYIINGKGHQYSLMDIDHWLYKPNNLGARFNSKYSQIDAEFIRTKRISKPEDIKGKIMFAGANQYDDYFNFIQFLAIEPLTLVYVTNNTYYVSVDLKQIDKSEIEDGILKCDILFKRLGRWYQEKKVQNMDAATDGKVYSHGYPVSYSEYDAQTVTVDCDSSYDAPTRLIIFGPCVNPYWNHYLNGKIIATGKCNCSIQTGRRLVIDCLGHKYGIREEDSYGNVKNNYYGASDFETKRFIELGLGKNRIAVDHDGTNTLKILIEARVEYETV